MTQTRESAQKFFSYARERHAIYLRRQAGVARDRLTEDPILSTYRFCNVFRELDTTTVWLREHVREPMRSLPEVLLAVVIYRWFNRAATGEAIFQPDAGLLSPFHLLVQGHWTLKDVRSAILAKRGAGPYITGSYIIKSPDGYPKLDGVLYCIGRFMATKKYWPCANMSWREVADWCLDQYHSPSMEDMWMWLRQHEFIGDFMAYEIVSDLIYTDLLCRAPDIMTWANAGPGAKRGLNRLYGRPLEKQVPKTQQCAEMRELLAMSQEPEFWPQWDGEHYVLAGDIEPPWGTDPYKEGSWPTWDMRTVEHGTCEMDKLLRVANGEGAPRQKFKP